jgi:putative ABC transport system ATP-binding protein
MAMIEIRQLNKYYGQAQARLHVLKNVDLQIESGEMVSIMGASGSGKSTLLNVLGLLDAFDGGHYTLNGIAINQQLREAQAARLRNYHLGFVFQSFNLLAYKTAAENVALPLYYQNIPRKERLKRAEAWLERVGLEHRKSHYPHEMSGGQKQRVAIARALVTSPAVVLADEPTGALDSVTSQDIMALFKDIHADGNTLVLVTHEKKVAEQTGRIIWLQDGEVTYQRPELVM